MSSASRNSARSAAFLEHDYPVVRRKRVDVLLPEMARGKLQSLKQYQRFARATLFVPKRRAVAQEQIGHQKFTEAVTP
jgi:hypothetical protein